MSQKEYKKVYYHSHAAVSSHAAVALSIVRMSTQP